MTHRQYINNWDIVDSSAHLIVGPHLESRSRDTLYDLARSKSLWDRRIAMMATYHYIRQGDYRDTLKLAALLRDDEHDLIHKVVGWMLREIGNRGREVEERDVRPTLAVGKDDENLGLEQHREVRVDDVVRFPAGHNQAKR